jgi:hypothetical protein
MKDKLKISTFLKDFKNVTNSEINLSDVIMVAGSVFIHVAFCKSLSSDKNKFSKFLEEIKKDKK